MYFCKLHMTCIVGNLVFLVHILQLNDMVDHILIDFELFCYC